MISGDSFTLADGSFISVEREHPIGFRAYSSSELAIFLNGCLFSVSPKEWCEAPFVFKPQDNQMFFIQIKRPFQLKLPGGLHDCHIAEDQWRDCVGKLQMGHDERRTLTMRIIFQLRNMK